MARPRSQLQTVLENLMGGAEDETKKLNVYFQPPTSGMVYPCIKYERNDSFSRYADNLKFLLYKRYDLTVIDRNPDSLIPDQVETLPHSRFDRFYVADGLNHFVFNLYF